MISKWIEKNKIDFKKCRNNSELIFSPIVGPRMFSRLYNNSWILSEPTNNKLTYKKGSWVWSNWGEYLKKIITSRGTLTAIFNMERKLLAKEAQELEDNLLHSPNFKSDLNKWLKITCKTLPSLNNLELDVLVNSDNPEINENAMHYLFKHKKTTNLLVNNVNKRSYLEQFNLWKYLIKWLIDLNIYNASTFACDDLLENDLKLPTDITVEYCRVRSLSKHPALEQKLFEQGKPKKTKRLISKQRKEFNQTFTPKGELKEFK